ncbi:MAG TPA: CDP-diacylglycerol--glycerol-3-phosphate 3-phosphatidyltransferase [Ruminococcaceae bacterium]|nr:CDP-diacylglycerol--glycerol-3-phosphate 3-phosphatidyltransferase [Oscillospiraceae bacterium]
MTLPNKLTLSRVIAAPVIMLFAQLSFSGHGAIAGILFIAACVTDALDGYLSRKNHQVSSFGKIMDPIADKVLILAALLPLMAVGRVSIWIGLILLVREFIVAAVRMQVYIRGGAIIAASLWGKLKTVFQDIAFALLLLNMPALSVLADVILAAAVILTVVSMADYCWKHRDIFAGV